jgi:hypothetical protein
MQASAGQVHGTRVTLLARWTGIHTVDDRFSLNSQHATECSGGIIRLGSIVTDEDLAVTTITKERATKLSDVRRGLHPARRL